MNQSEFQINDKRLFWMGAITMYGYPLLALAIFALFKPSANIYDLVFQGKPLALQLMHGLIFGLAAFLVIYSFLKSKQLAEFSSPLFNLAKQMNWMQILFISLAAGVGEELLFRVCLQYFWGIWPTAILFVAIHGYLDISNPKIFLYGLFMTIVSAGFGYLYLQYGTLAPIMAHFLIDLLILGYIKLTPIEELMEDDHSLIE